MERLRGRDKDLFEEQIEAADRRLEEMKQTVGESPEQVASTREAMEELSIALEELHVAAEELRQQNDELIGTRQALEDERQRYLELFEFAPDPYLVTDSRGVIQEANRAAASLLGVPRDFLTGKPLILFVAEERHKEFYMRLEQLQDRTTWEGEMKPREGGQFWALVTTAWVRDDQGRRVGLRWLLRDITSRRRLEEEREHLLYELQDALSNIKTLQGLLPICASCKKIRDDQGYWTQIETYIKERSQATFTHGICPACRKRLYGELTAEK